MTSHSCPARPLWSVEYQNHLRTIKQNIYHSVHFTTDYGWISKSLLMAQNFSGLPKHSNKNDWLLCIYMLTQVYVLLEYFVKLRIRSDLYYSDLSTYVAAQINKYN